MQGSITACAARQMDTLPIVVFRQFRSDGKPFSPTLARAFSSGNGCVRPVVIGCRPILAGAYGRMELCSDERRGPQSLYAAA